MKFIKKIYLDAHFFAPRYLSLHTSKFRRLSADAKIIDNITYHSWQFKSPQISIGCAMIPPTNASHLLLFSLEKTENIQSVAYQVSNYLRINQKTIEQLIPGQSLYVRLDDWGK
ncbi:hypothetical protein I6N95_12380 [Vagococcus sp. BWB3-3]|uniref:Uncharacterized protein n=1 Tax=Vagococcus allomyrinae TaxID=2794353 RepID=A0A940PC42_9ENTE|nr:hypothetical protein [Vagococcus allomyrinae]MBP1041807.1 hypothetical protein [Vagococcus allomyrinae]